MGLTLNVVDVALTLGFMGSSIALRASFAKSRPWNLAPQAHCGPDQLLSTPVLLICLHDDSIILTTVASFLCSIVVGQNHRQNWIPNVVPVDIGERRDEGYNALRWRFETCSPATGLLHFDVGSQLPNTGLNFAGGNFVPAGETDENWVDWTRYPRPDECARIWRRLVHLAPDAAPSLGSLRREITAITLHSVLDDSNRPLAPVRVRIGSKNSWTRLLGPGVPAVLVPASACSLYNSDWRPWPTGSIPRPDGTLWLQATGLSALQREVRPSPSGDAALIADCWMSVARHIKVHNVVRQGAPSSMRIWFVRRARDNDTQNAHGWGVWAPMPHQNIDPFAPLPWILE